MGDTSTGARRGPLRWWREKQRDKQERTGPSAEAKHEQRSSEKVFDPHAVAKNAGKHFPPT
jgi:hypothetical protein